MTPGAERELGAAFTGLLERYAVELSETLLLNGSGDFAYISDLETYEVYLLKASCPDELPDRWRDYRGKRCYELLQDRSSPCPFCNNARLEHGRYSVWSHHNPVTGREYLLNDRLVYWEGREARLESAADVSDPERMRQVLQDRIGQQGMLTTWMQLLADEEDLEAAFDQALPILRSYYGAECAAICAYTRVETVRCRMEKACDLFPLVAHPSEQMRETIGRALSGDKQLVIRDAAQVGEAEDRALLEANGLRSLCLTPIFSRGKLLGLLGLGNLKEHVDALFLLKPLAACMAAAIRQRMLQDEKLRIQYTDALTGSLNFEGFKVEVGKTLRQWPGRKCALWYCDLRKFKFINEVFGFDVGDRLLRYWVSLVRRRMQPGEVFCRVAADNLASLCWYGDTEELRARFDWLQQELAGFPELASKRFHVELVTGVYLIETPEDLLDIDEMLNRANMAQKQAKIRPGSQLGFYDDALRRREVQELAFTSAAQDALRDGEFQLYLQPQVNIQNRGGDCVRAEVLCRWQQRKGSFVMPGQFIELFEQSGLIVELDHYMFERACRYLRELLDETQRKVCLSVNVSRLTLLQPNFLRDYVRVKERWRIPNRCVELEFTESVAVEDVERFSRLVSALRGSGFLCAMDDFGTGQSSLNVLQRLPLDVLKLDRKFFDDTRDQERNRTVVSCVLHMARMLDMCTVAEGIEQQAQVELLRSMGCDYIQGYIFSKPLSAGEFRRRLKEGWS